MNDSKQYWFKRRRYGYGWTPVTWQGWALVGAWAVVVLGTSFVVLPAKPAQPTSGQLAVFFAVLAASVILLVVVSSLKGPRPRWRWGKSASDNPDEDF